MEPARCKYASLQMVGVAVLPTFVFVYMCQFIGNAKDLARLATVSKSWRVLPGWNDIWRHVYKQLWADAGTDRVLTRVGKLVRNNDFLAPWAWRCARRTMFERPFLAGSTPYLQSPPYRQLPAWRTQFTPSAKWGECTPGKILEVWRRGEMVVIVTQLHTGDVEITRLMLDANDNVMSVSTFRRLPPFAKYFYDNQSSRFMSTGDSASLLLLCDAEKTPVIICDVGYMRRFRSLVASRHDRGDIADVSLSDSHVAVFSYRDTRWGDFLRVWDLSTREQCLCKYLPDLVGLTLCSGTAYLLRERDDPTNPREKGIFFEAQNCAKLPSPSADLGWFPMEMGDLHLQPVILLDYVVTIQCPQREDDEEEEHPTLLWARRDAAEAKIRGVKGEMLRQSLISGDPDNERVFELLGHESSNRIAIIEHIANGDDTLLLSIMSGNITTDGRFVGQRTAGADIFYCGGAGRTTYEHFWMELSGCYGISRKGDVARLDVRMEAQFQPYEHDDRLDLIPSNKPRKRR